ncbi:MAG TPA: YncE family protein [Candidatus Acidoferrum sp.]
MKILKFLSIFFCVASSALAQQAPWARPDIPISSRDRVYTADQTSNTVSVIDPSTNRMLGVIKLGDPVPGSLSPLYKGQLLVHGLGYSPDSKTLAVVSIGSNSVTLIDTTTNEVKGTVYVGRSPHEAFFTPDGRELWVTVRGENYVSVIDSAQLKEVRRIQMANGPGMTTFGPDGHYAFVCSSFTPELTVVHTRSHQVLKRLPQVSPFCPNIAVSPESDEVWITLKDSGKVQVFSAKPPFEQKALLETGPITNHVNFVNNRNGKFAYVTVGGRDQVKAYRRGAVPELVATIPVGSLPHGVWPSGDGSRIYVGLENDNMVAAIDTLTNQVIANIPVGETPQALVYVPNAVPVGSPSGNLSALFQGWDTTTLRLQSADPTFPNANASVAVNSLGLLDLVQIAAVGLAPSSQYQVYLADVDHAPFGELVPLATLRTNADGAGIVQTVGPLKSLSLESLSSSTATDAAVEPRRFLVVTELNYPSRVVLQQATSRTATSTGRQIFDEA